MASTYLTRTPSSNGNRQKWTWSGWTKRSGLLNSGSHYLFASNDGSNDYSMIAFASDTLRYYDYTGSSFSSQLVTNRLFRDTNAWYHIVVAYDSTQGTSSNRIKLYVNGVQETSLSTATYPSQNHNSYFNKSGYPNRIGSESGSGGFYDGSMSHIHFTDGYVYDATPFGETDTTTGEWKIKTTVTGVTYGTNGYYILKDGNSVTDQSGQSNNLTVGGGTLTKTEDNPSNVFATLNPLASLPNTGVSTFTNGNTTSQGVNGSYVNGGSNLQMSSGKWYAECKYIATSSDVGRMIIGITQDVSEISRINQDTGSYNTYFNNYDGAGAKSVQGSNPSSYGNAYGINDIIGIALDLDNEKLYFSINGTWQNSGVPTSGSTGTGSITSSLSGTQAPCIRYLASKFDTNFGNGYFGITAITSAGSNGNGSLFEYDVPSGYYALNTKNINTYG